jgi:two-component system cell cycle response regulator DivK
MSNGRILLVEDNHDNLTLIADFLQVLDYEVFFASDGAQGVQMARELHPDLILMDLSLPIMDGWSATRLLKADEKYSVIPIIALTAHAMKGDRERALAAGCDDYVTKPLNLMELAGKLTHWLAARKPI